MMPSAKKFALNAFLHEAAPLNSRYAPKRAENCQPLARAMPTGKSVKVQHNTVVMQSFFPWVAATEQARMTACHTRA
jgi:hypothetical protein